MGCPLCRSFDPRVLAVLLVFAFASCGGAPEGVTMSAGGCTYDGPRSVGKGPISLALSNELQGGHAEFALVRLRKGHAYRELSSYVESGEDWGKLPAFVDAVARLRVEARGRDTLETSVYGGTYAIMCAQVPNTVEIARFAAGPIVVAPD